MLDKPPLDEVVIYIAVGALGGLARIALGVKEDGVKLWQEVFRVCVIAPPMAVMAGVYAESNGMGIATYPIAYFVGLASINIARTMMTEGITGIISAFVRVKK